MPRMAANSRPKALGYVRLSDYREGDSSTSPERQREAIEGYALAKGWELVAVEEDLDVSGSSRGMRLDRPGLVRLRERFDEAEHLIVASLDRAARNVVDFMTLAEEAEESGVALVSVKETLDLSTPTGRFVATILAAFAAMEAETIRERSLAGQAKARTKGRFLGGVPAFGYAVAPHTSGEGKTLVVDPEEAALVKDLAERVLGGETVYSLTRDLNQRGIRSKTGKEWSVQAVRQVLTGPAVVGRRTHKGKVVTGPDGLPLQVYPPVLDLDTWTSLRSVLEVDKPGRERLVKRSPSRLLSGLVSCGRCGARMNPATSGGGKSYRCSTNSRGRDCVGVSVRCDALEDFVVDHFLRSWGWLPVTEIRESAPPEPAELVEIGAAIEETTRAMIEDDSDDVALGERLAALKSRRKEIRETPRERVVEVVETGETFRDVFQSTDDVEARRNLLARAIETVSVAPGRAGRRPFAPERVTIIPRQVDPVVD
jgi:site-specific DNA recombinase